MFRPIVDPDGRSILSLLKLLQFYSWEMVLKANVFHRFCFYPGADPGGGGAGAGAPPLTPGFEAPKLSFIVPSLIFLVFRGFKFTLKPPNSIACGKLRLAIWDTSFWTFWVKFGHNGP